MGRAARIGRASAWAALVVAVALVGCRTAAQSAAAPAATDAKTTAAAIPEPATKNGVIVPVVKTDAEWKKELPPQAYWVMREAGTEIAFTGRYWNEHARGTYVCAACGLPLFTSKTKYDSGTGWPSFWQTIAPNRVSTDMETYRGQGYTEVKCARCGSHLGHVFDDGPAPTGMRYCMNSVALKFIPSR